MKKLIPKLPIELGFPRRVYCGSRKFLYTMVNKYNKIKNVYFSLYSCGKDRDYGEDTRFRKFNIHMIYFDFDEASAFFDVCKLHDYCKSKNINHTMVFSGGGYHFYIFTKKGKKLKNPKSALRKSQDFFCKMLGLNLDEHVRGDIKRISRVPNTWNKKRKRYCIPISEEDLKEGEAFIKKKASKQHFQFYFYGNDFFDISKYDTGERGDRLEFPEVEKKLKIKIKGDEVLKSLPLCISSLLARGNPGWRERYLIISYLRDSGYIQSEVVEILQKFLTKAKFNHCVYEEEQVKYLFRRSELFFPSCIAMRNEGRCPKKKKCKHKDKLYA